MPEDDIIDVSDFDPNFRDEIAAEPGGEYIRRCFSCGTCSASCPVGGVTDKYNPRRIIHMALLGMRQEVLSSGFVWLCSVCYTCYERCPQDVRIPELMNAIRNIAVREGRIPQTFKTQVGQLRAHGRLYEVGDYENERRQEYDLPPIREESAQVRQILDDMDVEEEAE
ncbi:MAG: 4Fe-4S dicluster domain-containing protein [Anaerolineae bacterium]|nr:4Fe-4S dicluster domain-containing protein [Anaerolineae bacterium]